MPEDQQAREHGIIVLLSPVLGLQPNGFDFHLCRVRRRIGRHSLADHLFDGFQENDLSGMSGRTTLEVGCKIEFSTMESLDYDIAQFQAIEQN